MNGSIVNGSILTGPHAALPQLVTVSSAAVPAEAEKIDDDGRFNQALFLLGVLVLIGVMFRMSYRRRRRKAIEAATPPSDPKRSRGNPSDDASDGAHDHAMHLHEVAREWEAKLDTRSRFLRQLIEDADRATSELRATMAAFESAQDDVSHEPAPETTPEQGRVDVDAAGPDEIEVAEPLFESEEPGVKAAESVAQPSTEPASDALRDRILALSKAGESPATIAEQVERPIGEVKLVLSMSTR